MPLYEYECQSCSTRFEHLVRENDRPICPSCHGEQLERVLSVFAVRASSDTSPRASQPSPCAGCAHAGGPGACGMA